MLQHTRTRPSHRSFGAPNKSRQGRPPTFVGSGPSRPGETGDGMGADPQPCSGTAGVGTMEWSVPRWRGRARRSSGTGRMNQFVYRGRRSSTNLGAVRASRPSPMVAARPRHGRDGRWAGVRLAHPDRRTTARRQGSPAGKRSRCASVPNRGLNHRAPFSGGRPTPSWWPTGAPPTAPSSLLDDEKTARPALGRRRRGPGGSPPATQPRRASRRKRTPRSRAAPSPGRARSCPAAGSGGEETRAPRAGRRGPTVRSGRQARSRVFTRTLMALERVPSRDARPLAGGQEAADRADPVRRGPPAGHRPTGELSSNRARPAPRALALGATRSISSLPDPSPRRPNTATPANPPATADQAAGNRFTKKSSPCRADARRPSGLENTPIYRVRFQHARENGVRGCRGRPPPGRDESASPREGELGSLVGRRRRGQRSMVPSFVRRPGVARGLRLVPHPLTWA